MKKLYFSCDRSKRRFQADFRFENNQTTLDLTTSQAEFLSCLATKPGTWFSNLSMLLSRSSDWIQREKLGICDKLRSLGMERHQILVAGEQNSELINIDSARFSIDFSLLAEERFVATHPLLLQESFDEESAINNMIFEGGPVH